MMDNKIYIGVSYYPEHWPKERWPEDVRMMKEAGLMAVRIVELAWSRLEPEDNRFDFQWVDDFIELASREGLQIILGTPTEAAPIWLKRKHPEIVSVDKQGHDTVRRGWNCHNSHTYRFYVERLVKKMAEHFAKNTSVIGWQIDNELKAVHCYCRECESAYRGWLKARYGTLENLNRQWGTVFWSQEYNVWNDVRLPVGALIQDNVSQMLDYYRFQSDTTVDFLNVQVDIIKRYAPHQFVTHNTIGLFPWLNFFDLGKKLDVNGLDLYPSVDSNLLTECMSQDLHRGVKQDNFWMMEQKNGYFNSADYNLAIEPGLVRMWSWQDISRGANGVLFYHWRSGRFSWEQNPNGVLLHDGSPRRAYYEIQQLTKELEGISSKLAATKVETPAAILYSYDVIWAQEAHKFYSNCDYRTIVAAYHKQLVKLGITADLVAPTADLSRYKLVFAPSLMMINEDIRRNLEAYVKQGGCLIIGARSGMKTWENVTIETSWPGPLSELAGVKIEEFEVMPDRISNSISYKGNEYQVTAWLDILKAVTAETLAVYTKKFYAGKAAIAKNRYGKGLVYYIGVMGNDDLLATLIADIAEDRGVAHAAYPEGILVTRRKSEADCFTFYVNITSEPLRVPLQENGISVFTGEPVQGEITLPAYDVLIVHVVT